MKTIKRNRRIYIRFTDEEYESIMSYSKNFNSISHYIRCAINEYSNKNIKDKLAAIDMLIQYYDKHINLLSHTASNLNQITKRANELGNAGLLTQSFLQSAMPDINNATALNREVKKLLDSLIKKLA